VTATKELAGRALGIVLTSLLALLLLLHPRVSRAHTPGISSGVYFAQGQSLDVKLSFSRRELAVVCAGLDADRDGDLSADELSRKPDCLDLSHLLRVSADDTPCVGSPIDSQLAEADGVAMRASYTCASRPDHFTVTLGFLHELPVDHRHIVRSEGETTSERSFGAKDTSFTVSPPLPPPSRTDTGHQPARETDEVQGPSFFFVGVAHILRGFDHLVFVFGLLLARGGVARANARPLFLAVTAFSIGHSLSLALAVNGVAILGPRWIEPLIAGSIAAIGVENLFLQSAARRWRITLPFGFVHGFGFAGALRTVLGAKVFLPLITFNLGVEAGQLLAIVAMVAVLSGLARWRLLTTGLLRAANLGLVAFGVGLALYRIISP
jgi:hypothetical protein